MELISFEEAIAESAQYSKRHLLLGNGFSIACRGDVFHYDSLFNQADFSQIPEVCAVFDALGTQDFEVAIRALENAANILIAYAQGNEVTIEKMFKHSEALKEILVATIARNHPSIPNDISDEKYWSCRKFLAHFLKSGGQIFTLNYDLLLYWALMHDDMPFDDPIELEANDGFGNDEDNFGAEYVVWQGETGAHNARVHFLHGAVHLFDSGSELKKYTWIRSGVPLVEQAREAISNNSYPLFVSEGSSQQKKNKIIHNAYLYQGFKQLTANVSQVRNCFFIFGHSLAENDDHILKRLSRGRFPKLYVGIYGDPSTKENKNIIQRAKKLSMERSLKNPLEIVCYDANSASVWG